MPQLARLSPKNTQGFTSSPRRKSCTDHFRKALIIVCHSLALPTTVFRLLHRIIDRRLWWDDFWAAFGLISEVMLFAVYIKAPMGIPRPRNPAQNAARWMTLMCYTTTLWAARLTVAVTIIRLVPKCVVRRNAMAVSVCFFLFMLTMVIQKAIGCGHGSSSCMKYKYPGYMELIMDILADIWLLAAPAYMLWNMNLQRNHYKLIQAIFLCGIFTALASIAHVVFILLSSPSWLGITGHIEVTVAVIVSNLLVVVTYVYRVFRTISSKYSEPKPNVSKPPPYERANGDKNPRLPAPAAPEQPIHSDSARSSGTMSTTGAEDSNHTSGLPQTISRDQTTSIELTELSHLGTTLDLSTANTRPSYGSTDVVGSIPFSSFSYPTSSDHPSRQSYS